MNRAERSERARDLRKHATDCERLLWSTLRRHAFFGQKFRRQHPIGRYIVDFCCVEKKLVIELDGSQHASNQSYDLERSEFLKRRGFRILRFWNHEFLMERDGVLEKIRLELNGSN